MNVCKSLRMWERACAYAYRMWERAYACAYTRMCTHVCMQCGASAGRVHAERYLASASFARASMVNPIVRISFESTACFESGCGKPGASLNDSRDKETVLQTQKA